MPHISKRLVLALAVLLTAGVFHSAPAAAQATRTWISGVGDDANPCSRTAPCKTFAGAISKTAAGGEINCLDPGGFGAVTITKSITLDCTDTMAGVLVAGTNGITINTVTDPNSVVVLRGLSIDGGPPGSNSLSGVRVVEASKVVIENSRIFNFSGTPGRGITVDGGAVDMQVTVINTTIDNNAGGGIYVAPGSGHNAAIELDNVRLLNNGGAAFTLTTAAGGNALTGTIRNSLISGGGLAGTSGIIAKIPSGTAQLSISSSTISRNDQYGIRLAGGTIRVDTSTITSNGTGVTVASGQAISFGNNRLAGNTADGAFSSTIPTN